MMKDRRELGRKMDDVNSHRDGLKKLKLRATLISPNPTLKIFDFEIWTVHVGLIGLT